MTYNVFGGTLILAQFNSCSKILSDFRNAFIVLIRNGVRINTNVTVPCIPISQPILPC